MTTGGIFVRSRPISLHQLLCREALLRISVHRFWSAVYVVYVAALVWGSLDADPGIPDLGVLTWDKFLHTAAYAVLTLLGGLALGGGDRSPLRRWSIAGLAALGFGALLEAGQHLLTTTRHTDLDDLVADGLGIGLIWVGVFLWRVLRGAPDREAP